MKIKVGSWFKQAKGARFATFSQAHRISKSTVRERWYQFLTIPKWLCLKTDSFNPTTSSEYNRKHDIAKTWKPFYWKKANHVSRKITSQMFLDKGHCGERTENNHQTSWFIILVITLAWLSSSHIMEVMFWLTCSKPNNI